MLPLSFTIRLRWTFTGTRYLTSHDSSIQPVPQMSEFRVVAHILYLIIPFGFKAGRKLRKGCFHRHNRIDFFAMSRLHQATNCVVKASNKPFQRPQITGVDRWKVCQSPIICLRYQHGMTVGPWCGDTARAPSISINLWVGRRWKSELQERDIYFTHKIHKRLQTFLGRPCTGNQWRQRHEPVP